MGKHVLVSDIAVHREQLDGNADFFAPDDHRRLADLLRRYRDADPVVRPYDYGLRQKRFAEDLLRLLTEVDSDLRQRHAARLVIAPERRTRDEQSRA
jgi:hypothetical protein